MTNHLEIFRHHYPSINVTVYDDYMVYKVQVGAATRAAIHAMEVVEEYGLNLLVIPASGHRKDSFLVKKLGSD